MTNEKGNLAMRSITITVRENHSPIIELTANEHYVAPLGNCTISCEASDPDGDSLSYAWLASGGDITGEGSAITWTAPEGIGNYTIIAVVTDEMGGKSTRSLVIKVAINHPPVIETVVAQYSRLSPTHSTIIECTASDPDGDELSYTWSTGRGGIFAEGRIAVWVAPDCYGTYNIAVVVKDGRGGEASQTVQITVGCG